jgi:hypothetical protein
MVYKKGCPVSFIKGISHYNNNICKATMYALKQCRTILYETNPKKMKNKGNSESIVYDYIENMKMEKIYLDRSTKEIRNKLPDLMMGFDDEFVKRRERVKKAKEKGEKISSNRTKWISDRSIGYSMRYHKRVSKDNKSFNKFCDYALTDRNSVWIPIIKKKFRNKKCFLLCGDAHVDDLLERLEKSGYSFVFIPQMRYRFSYKKIKKYLAKASYIY